MERLRADRRSRRPLDVGPGRLLVLDRIDRTALVSDRTGTVYSDGLRQDRGKIYAKQGCRGRSGEPPAQGWAGPALEWTGPTDTGRAPSSPLRRDPGRKRTLGPSRPRLCETRHNTTPPECRRGSGAFPSADRVQGLHQGAGACGRKFDERPLTARAPSPVRPIPATRPGLYAGEPEACRRDLFQFLPILRAPRLAPGRLQGVPHRGPGLPDAGGVRAGGPAGPLPGLPYRWKKPLLRGGLDRRAGLGLRPRHRRVRPAAGRRS